MCVVFFLMMRFAVKLTEVTLNYSILDQLEAFSITGKGKTSPEAQMCKLLCQLQHFLPSRHNFTQMTGTQTVAAVKLGAFARNVPTAPAQKRRPGAACSDRRMLSCSVRMETELRLHKSSKPTES